MLIKPEYNKPLFGISQPMLNKLSYITVESIFYGVNNFDVPCLYKNMNPTEIRGLHSGICKKYDDYGLYLKKIPLI